MSSGAHDVCDRRLRLESHSSNFEGATNMLQGYAAVDGPLLHKIPVINSHSAELVLGNRLLCFSRLFYILISLWSHYNSCLFLVTDVLPSKKMKLPVFSFWILTGPAFNQKNHRDIYCCLRVMQIHQQSHLHWYVSVLFIRYSKNTRFMDTNRLLEK